ETVMKALVTYNATSSGTTADGRIRNVATGGLTITVEADGGGGNTVDWYCAHDHLLETLQKLARIAGGDFDLIKTAATTWDFKFYDGQRGTDRSSSVIFSLDHGNMARPRYQIDRREERTVAIVGGGGEGDDRTFVTRT